MKPEDSDFKQIKSEQSQHVLDTLLSHLVGDAIFLLHENVKVEIVARFYTF